VRLAILSDIHEDYENLLNIVEKAEARGFDKLICLGDISGFSLPYYKYGKSRNASACLALLNMNWIWILDTVKRISAFLLPCHSMISSPLLLATFSSVIMSILIFQVR